MSGDAFTMTPLWLHGSTKLSLAAKNVLVVIADHQNRTTGQCNPRLETVAKETALSLATVKRALAELVRCRIVAVTKGQRANSYQLAPRSDWRYLLRDQIDPAEDSSARPKRSCARDQIELPEAAVPITEPELLNHSSLSNLSHRNGSIAEPPISPLKKPAAERETRAVQRFLPGPKPEPITALVVSKPQAETFETWFEQKFWPFYPRKVGKATARKAARRAGSSAKLRDEMVAGLYRQLPELKTREPQYVPHASTWIRQERWRDEVEAPRRSAESRRDRDWRSAVEEFLKEPS